MRIERIGGKLYYVGEYAGGRFEQRVDDPRGCERHWPDVETWLSGEQGLPVDPNNQEHVRAAERRTWDK